MAQNLRSRVIFLCALSAAFILSACASSSYQVRNTLAGSAAIGADEVVVLADRTLRNMGYEVTENNAFAGYVHARKPVMEDLYGRYTAIDVQVDTEPSGDKTLSVQATTCHGCAPEGMLNPVWIGDNFVQEFNRAAASSRWHAGNQATAALPKGNSHTGEAQQKRPLSHGEKKAPPQAQENVKPTPAPKDPEKKNDQKRDNAPSVKIGKVATVPGEVHPGGKFGVEITFRADNGKNTKDKVAVLFSYAIEKDGKTLFEPDPEKLEVPNGQSWQIVKSLTATQEKGTYLIRVSIRFGSQKAEAKTSLTVK